jgi:hypothetical protein
MYGRHYAVSRILSSRCFALDWIGLSTCVYVCVHLTDVMFTCHAGRCAGIDCTVDIAAVEDCVQVWGTCS